MTAPDQSWWDKAREAREKLVSQMLAEPELLMVDIGQDPLGLSTTPVLRVHMRARSTGTLKVPESIDDIPVRVIQGDYRLQ